MRAIAILTAAMLAAGLSASFGQDICQPNYSTCMVGCGAMKGAAQARCVETCQAKNTECYDRRIGAPSQFNAQSQPQPQSDDALAARKATPAPSRR
jgi:hypothetical protein